MILGPRVVLPAPQAQPITHSHVSCVLNAYRARAALLRSRLTGDALAEARLTTEQHVQIQQALFEKGFLSSDQVGFGTGDGEFGPITRKAIRQFQQSLGASPSGFLSDEQWTALLERPGEREAREARRAVEEQARQAALEAQAARAAAEAKARQEVEIAAAKAKQEAEAARQEAEAAAAKAKQEAEAARLEAEAEAAREWQRKVDEAQAKGPQYAEKGFSKWSLTAVANPMTDDNDYTVSSVQKNGKGAVAGIEGTCPKPGEVTFTATLTQEIDPDSPLGLPDFAGSYIAGTKRINDDAPFPTRFQTLKFRNQIVVASLTSSHAGTEPIETTWRVLAEIETARGRIFIQIPMFDANVQKLLTACGKQYENAMKRRGLADAPRAVR